MRKIFLIIFLSLTTSVTYSQIVDLYLKDINSGEHYTLQILHKGTLLGEVTMSPDDRYLTQEFKANDISSVTLSFINNDNIEFKTIEITAPSDISLEKDSKLELMIFNQSNFKGKHRFKVQARYCETKDQNAVKASTGLYGIYGPNNHRVNDEDITQKPKHVDVDPFAPTRALLAKWREEGLMIWLR